MIITYLVWRFCIKNKRQQYEQENWVEDEAEHDAVEKQDFAMRRDARASTHTVGSIASTVLTRASNIIQIAYIPGVTNRSGPHTPGLLVPPVPPIPIALSTATTPGYEDHDQHFFMPGDLRDSTYSGMSDRTSYANRSSFASTIYGKNAIVSPLPAQTVIRGKAAVVSVGSGGAHSPGEIAPPVPTVNYDRFGARPPPSPAFSVGSTFLNNATSATSMRPQVVRVNSGPDHHGKARDGADDGSRQSTMSHDSNAITIINDTPLLEQGPFGDPPLNTRRMTYDLDALGEAPRGDYAAGGSSLRREHTPFGDEHETRD